VRDENYKVEEYEKGMQRFYAYLSLFTMSMLGLVVATNIFQMYLFWELVGVCSYLLIGFYYPKHAAVHASKKAFIVTRFADLFFLIGILFYSFYVGTFNYALNIAWVNRWKIPAM
jgi:NADH-quinone oxidoreductase subunit L